MDFLETKEKIQQLIKEINSVEDTDTFDDIKDVELLESFIREILLSYCQEMNYEIEGFPFVQLAKIENRDPGYDEDFMTYERMDLYLHRLALEKRDVFELCSLGYQYFTLASEKEEVLEMIKGTISLIEGDGVSLDLTEEELEYLNRVEKHYRPKLP